MYVHIIKVAEENVTKNMYDYLFFMVIWLFILLYAYSPFHNPLPFFYVHIRWKAAKNYDTGVIICTNSKNQHLHIHDLPAMCPSQH